MKKILILFVAFIAITSCDAILNDINNGEQNNISSPQYPDDAKNKSTKKSKCCTCSFCGKSFSGVGYHYNSDCKVKEKDSWLINSPLEPQIYCNPECARDACWNER